MGLDRIGEVVGIAVRTAKNGPMRELSSATVATGGGLAGDLDAPAERGVTFLARGQWEAVRRALGVSLPWHTRRANILVDAETLAPLVGRHVRVGDVTVAILDESKPCDVMAAIHDGLREALAIEGRGGVYGKVLRGGTMRLHDEVVYVEPAES